MRRSILSFIVVVSAVAGQTKQTNPNPGDSSAQPSIGRIDFITAIISTSDGKRGAVDLERKFAPKKQELVQMQTELTRLELQLESQVGPSRQDAELQVNKLRESLKTATNSAQVELEQDQRRIVQTIRDKMMLIVRAYAKEKGLLRIVDSKQDTTVFEADPSLDIKQNSSVDITQEIVAIYEGGATTDISGQIDEVARSGRYTALPPGSPCQADGSLGGLARYEIKNGTVYDLRVILSGPAGQEVHVPPNSSQTVTFPAGTYRILGKVSSPSVFPFFGEQVFPAGAGCGSQFYISPQR
ncbi:MAG TPA: OmpH family outer membrane protein [Bryobacteraceae bacterium]|nr:OmpH family outer membrane protein [Bryobacteraceae bacterium]